MVRQAAAAKAGDLSDVRRLQLEWWTAFRDALRARKAVPSTQSPRPRNWYNMALGRSGIHLSATANTFDNKIGVRVYIRSKYNGASALEQLRESKTEIEKEIGQRLAWDPNPDANDKVIVAYKDADLSRRDKWPEYLDWMVETTVRFRKAFGPRVKELDLNAEAAEEEA